MTLLTFFFFLLNIEWLPWLVPVSKDTVLCKVLNPPDFFIFCFQGQGFSLDIDCLLAHFSPVLVPHHFHKTVFCFILSLITDRDSFKHRYVIPAMKQRFIYMWLSKETILTCICRQFFLPAVCHINMSFFSISFVWIYEKCQRQHKHNIFKPTRWFQRAGCWRLVMVCSASLKNVSKLHKTRTEEVADLQTVLIR